jgi:thiamine pyrophosphate-dependent acetolactate synthase large subunit-like protein
MIIIDNKGYGIIRQTQDDFFKSNYVGTKISLKNNLAEFNPANICKSFNVKVLSINENIKKKDIDAFFKSDYQCLVISINHKYRVPYTKLKDQEVPFFY